MNLKKIFTMGVVMTTIMWSLGVATLVPSVANATSSSCPTLVAGDMIKVSGKAAIYVLDNNLNYRYFSDGDVFKTWNADESYGKYYKTITQTCFDSLSQPASAPYHVFYRAGSEVVKYLSSDTLYVVGLSQTLYPITDAAAKAIFGTSYKVKTVGLSEWPYYTKSTVTITEASVYPGMLVKVSGTTYFVDTNKVLREVTAEGMTANNFKAAYVRTLATSAIAGLTMGSTISTAVASLTQRYVEIAAGSGTPTTPTTNGTLTVSLSADTPAAISVPNNGTRIPFTKINLTASSDSSIVVDAITVKRTGLSSYDSFNGTAGSVWAEKSGVRVSSQSDMNNSDEANLTFSPVLTIPAGQTVSLEIIASVDEGDGNAALGIVSASAISSSGKTVSGSFPVYGNLMSFASYSVADVTFDINSNTSTVNVGDQEAELASFIVASSGTTTRDIIFKSLTLKNSGSEDLTSLANVYLEKSGNKVSSYGVVSDGRYITFTLTDSSGFGGMLIEKGDSVTFKVKGDVLSKENTADPSFTLKVNKTEDVSIIEKSTGFGASIVKDGEEDNVVISSGDISFVKKTTQPSDTDVIKGSNSNVSLLANIKADEKITADGLKVTWTGSDVVTSFENAKVYLNGYLLGSFDPDANNNTTGYEIESSLTLNKGDNELKITVDAKTDAEAADYIKFNIKNDVVLAGESPEYDVSGNAVSADEITGNPVGAQITIEGAEVSTTRTDGYSNNHTIVYGTTDVVLGKWNVKAKNDSVKISSISVAANAGTGTKIDDSSVFDMKIRVDGVQVGSTRDFSASGASFSSLNVAIAEDATKVVELLASFDTNATGTLKVTSTLYVEDSNGDEFTTAPTVSTIQHVVSTAGTLTVSLGSDTRKDSIVLAKAGVEEEVAQFKLAALNDAATVTELTLFNSTTGKIDNSRIGMVKIYSGSTLVGSDSLDSDGRTVIKISDDALKVTANSYKNIVVKVDLNTIEEASQSSSTLVMKLESIKFKGSSGTEVDQDENIAGHLMEIRNTRPVIAADTMSSVASKSSKEAVLKFSVTADSNGSINLTDLVFTENGSANAITAVNSFWLYEGDTEIASVTGTPAFHLTGDDVISIDTVKHFTVKADTSGIAVDDGYGLELNGDTVTNILWNEYFVGGNNPGNADYLYTLPITITRTY